MIKVSWVIVFGLGVVVSALVGSVWWYQLAKETAVSISSRKVEITIEKGSPTRQVAHQLRQAGLIHSPLAFSIAIKVRGATIKAGTFTLDAHDSLQTIAEELSKNPNSEVSVTIPEGWRVEQIGQRLLEKQIIEDLGSFITAARDFEGYLFPDTYRFAPTSSITTIIDRMRENFQARTRDINPLRDDVILASIVEREAKRDEDRPKMAGVFKNRLSKGMPLEADPTVQYSIDSQAFARLQNTNQRSYQFWGVITLEQAKTFESSYNTYRNNGLPPGPISNPGLKSIEAALNPEQHDYFYFFNLNDGSTIYSKTLDEHNANKRKYGFGS